MAPSQEDDNDMGGFDTGKPFNPADYPEMPMFTYEQTHESIEELGLSYPPCKALDELPWIPDNWETMD